MDMTKNQTNLYSLGKNKDIIVNRFLEDNMIVSLVLPNYNSLTNTSPIDILMKDHIYKVISIDNSQLEACVYVCIDTYVPYVENDSIKDIGLIINVFCHSSLLDCSTSEKAKFYKFGLYGNRIDMLSDVIDRNLNGLRGIGLGKLRLVPRNPIKIYQPSNKYYGKSLEYVVSDFNDIPLV